MSTAKVKNTSNFARTGVVTLGVPFSRGDNLQETDYLVVDGALDGYTNLKCQWYPQGARWDDGSVKYARVTFRVQLDALEEKTVTISKSLTYTAIPFIIDPSLVTSFLSTFVQFNANGVLANLDTINLVSNLIEGGGPEDHYARYKYFTHLPDNIDPRIKYLWMELVVEVYSGLNHIQFYFRWGFYRFFPTMSNAEGIDPVFVMSDAFMFRIIGPRTKIRWEEYKCPIVNRVSTNDVIYLSLFSNSGGGQFAAGSSHCYKGVFCYDNSSTSEAELVDIILAISDEWKHTYPISGIMPETPPYITSEANALNRSNILLNLLQGPMTSQNDPYNWPTCCNNPNTADTGQHGFRDYAFGLRGWPFLSTANYNWIPYLEFCTRQQATRHNWYYNTDGSVVAPDVFRNAGVRFWNGSFHTINEAFYRGFTRGVSGNETALSAGRQISGPDKEHYTNTMFILQGFITMDWFSLEYAKMYSKYWKYANRVDNYSIPTAIDDWGAARAVGRVSQCAAFLYEFYADPELKQAIKDRLDYNHPQTLLSKTAHPGGTEVLRVATENSPCALASCLPDLNHYRPWQEGAAAIGFYFLAKAILNETPNDAHGITMLEAARDISSTLILHTWPHGAGLPGFDRRFVMIAFPYPQFQAAQDFINGIGPIPSAFLAVGVTSGAQGYIYFYEGDNETGGDALLQWRIYLQGCSGTFQEGELLRLQTGQTAIIARIYEVLGWRARATASPTNGYARNITDYESTIVQPYLPPHPQFPAGNLRYNLSASLYHRLTIGAAPIAKAAAEIGYYPDSNQRLINDSVYYLNYYINISGDNDDNGDFEELSQCFFGYITPNLLSQSGFGITPSTLVEQGIVPVVTTSISNQSTSVTVTPSSSTILMTISTPSVSSTSSANVTLHPIPVSILVSVATQISKCSATRVVTFSSMVVRISSIESVFTTAAVVGRRVFTLVNVGRPIDQQVLGGATDPQEIPGNGLL